MAEGKSSIFNFSMVAIAAIIGIILMISVGLHANNKVGKLSNNAVGMVAQVVMAETTSTTSPMAIDSTGAGLDVEVAEVKLGCKWTEWKNRDLPSGTGDWETLADFTDVCKTPSAIDCKTSAGLDYKSTGQVVSCTAKAGLTCQNSLNANGCKDYKVRFCCPTTTTYTPFLIGIAETSPANDVVIAADVSQQLVAQNLISPTTTGLTKLFGEINALQLDNQVTLAIYNGQAVIIVGASSPSIHTIFASSVSTILYAKGITAKIITSSEVKSSNLADLFKMCTDSDGGKNYYIKGYTTNYAEGGITFNDNCDGSSVLDEQFCDGVNTRFELYTCPNGCSNGACLPSVTVNKTCVDTKPNGDSYTRGTVYNSDGSPIETGTVTEASNIDNEDMGVQVLSANSIIISVFGEKKTMQLGETASFDVTKLRVSKIDFYGLDNSMNKVTYELLSVTDTCSPDNRNVFMNFYCESDGVNSKDVNCQYGCSNGACQSTPSTGTTMIVQDIKVSTEGRVVFEIKNTGEEYTSPDGKFNQVGDSFIMLIKGVYHIISLASVTPTQSIYVDGQGPYVEDNTFTLPNPKVQDGGVCVLNNTNVALCSYNGVVYAVESQGGCGTTATSLSIEYVEGVNIHGISTSVLQGYTIKLQNGVTVKNLGAPCSASVLTLQFLIDNTSYTCTDTDGGRNFVLAGTMTDAASQGPKADYCMGSTTPNTLVEYSCTKGKEIAYMENYECPNGCSNGACVNLPTNFVAQTYTGFCGDNIVGWDEQCEGDNIRNSGFFKLRLEKLSSSSIDNDNILVMDGNEYNIQLLGLNGNSKTATLSVNGEKVTLMMSHQKTIAGLTVYIDALSTWENGEVGNVDLFLKGKSISYCSELDNSYTDGELSCTSNCRYDTSECEGGVSECTDSDGGVLPFVKGSCVDSRGVTITDSCISDDDNPGKTYVDEAYCLTPAMREHCKLYNDADYCDNLPNECYSSPLLPTAGLSWFYFERDDKYFCKYGCRDGKCIPYTWTSDVTLKDFPQPFLTQGGIPDATFVVGRRAALDDVIGITDIIASLQRYAGNNPFPMGLVQFDDVLTDDQIYNRNVVIVGGMCANSVAERIYGSPADCTEQDTPGVGKIRIMRNPHNSDKLVLLVHGYNADDTTRATRVLANWNDYNQEFKDNSELCVTGSLNNMQVSKCN